jgi:hypothetical protein
LETVNFVRCADSAIEPNVSPARTLEWFAEQGAYRENGGRISQIGVRDTQQDRDSKQSKKPEQKSKDDLAVSRSFGLRMHCVHSNHAPAKVRNFG